MTSRPNHDPEHSPGSVSTAVAAAPSIHKPATEATIAAFAAWLDSQLAELETRYQHNTTRQSIKRSLRRT